MISELPEVQTKEVFLKQEKEGEKTVFAPLINANNDHLSPSINSLPYSGNALLSEGCNFKKTPERFLINKADPCNSSIVRIKYFRVLKIL